MRMAGSFFDSKPAPLNFNLHEIIISILSFLAFFTEQRAGVGNLGAVFYGRKLYIVYRFQKVLVAV